MSEIVTMSHVRKAGLCARGAKAWFDQHGMNFREFVKNGLPLSEVELMDDALAQRVAKVARENGASNGR